MSILLDAKKNVAKRKFDPTSPEDLKAFQDFYKTKKWTPYCPFILDWPYDNVPDMIKSKLVDTYLDKIVAGAK